MKEIYGNGKKVEPQKPYWLGEEQRKTSQTTYDLTQRVNTSNGVYKAPAGNQTSTSAPKAMQYHSNGSTSLDDALMNDEITNNALKRAMHMLGSIGYNGQTQQNGKALGGYDTQPSETMKNFLAQVIVYTKDAKGNESLVVANYKPNEAAQQGINYGAKGIVKQGSPYAGNTPSTSYGASANKGN